MQVIFYVGCLTIIQDIRMCLNTPYTVAYTV